MAAASTAEASGQTYMRNPLAAAFEGHQDNYAIVGELVVISNTLDYLLTNVLIEILDLGSSFMLHPVIQTLDPVRKIEILKGSAKLGLGKGVSSFLKKADVVFKNRNIACHMQLVCDNKGEWVLTPSAAAKVFRSVDLENRRIKRVSLNTLKNAITDAEAALKDGSQL